MADTAEKRTVQKHESQWVPNKTNDQWTLHEWPFFLVINYRPREPLPYVGSLVGKVLTLGDFHAWATPEEAARGMVEWALAELSESYHEMNKLRGG